MSKSFSGQTFKCKERHMNFVKVRYVCGTFKLSNLLENLYPVRDGPFDFQGGCDFF